MTWYRAAEDIDVWGTNLEPAFAVVDRAMPRATRSTLARLPPGRVMMPEEAESHIDALVERSVALLFFLGAPHAYMLG